MRLGLKTPIVVRHPATASPWEATATVRELVDIAQTADEVGFHHLTCSEHVAVPVDVAAERGATYWDPLATLSHLAGQTSNIRLATSVLVLGYHHPIALAKQYGTLDQLSDGRVVLGVGVGSLQEEFELLGAAWTDRGAVANDTLAALRAALGSSKPSYRGSHYTFEGFIVDPAAAQARVPLWVGGRTPLSLRRAVALGDGWVPFGLSTIQLTTMLETIEVPHGFEIVLSPTRPLDPTGDPERCVGSLKALREAGATLAEVALRADSALDYTNQLAALGRLAQEIA